MKIEVIKRFSVYLDGGMKLMEVSTADKPNIIDLAEGIARTKISQGFAKKVVIIKIVDHGLTDKDVGKIVALDCLKTIDEKDKPKKKATKKAAKQDKKQNKLLNIENKEDK